MKLRLSSAVVGVATLATSAGLVLVGGVAANAATPPPWEPDPQSVGTISFFNAAGNAITSGNIDAGPFAAYAVGSAVIHAGDTRAILQEAQPNPNAATTGYNADQLSGVTTFPPATGPASITSQTNPVVTGSSGDLTLDDFIGEFPNTDPSGAGCAYSATPAGCTNTAYQNLYQLRLKTLDTGGNQTAKYDVADIVVIGTTWTQVFPAAQTATSTTLVAAPNPAVTTDSVTLTATESPVTPGSVDFKDGATDLGSAVVNGTGVATLSHTFGTAGTQALTATFTPTDATDFAGSTGSTSLVVNAPSTPTTTTAGVTEDGTAGDDVSMTATVKSGATPVTAGTVSFFDNGGSTALNPSPLTPNASGVVTFDLPSGLPAGAHSIVAKFAPSNVTQFQASQSAAQTFFLNGAAATGSPCAQTGSVCTDVQNIQTTIPIGTLVINTPFDAAHPLILPDMALNASGTEFTTSAPFRCIQVTDTTSGAAPWTAQALALPLADSTPPSPLPAGAVTSINPENVGLTGFTAPAPGTDGALCPDTQSYTGAVAVVDNPAAAGVSPTDGGSAGLGGSSAHTFATGSGGDGTSTLDSVLTLNAPTSSASGIYKGTITFTVAD